MSATCGPCEQGDHLECPTTKTQTVCCCYYPWKAEGAAAETVAWDRYYTTLPQDLKQKLSIYDLRRLGRGFRAAFLPSLQQHPAPAPVLGDKPPGMRDVITWVNERRLNCLSHAEQCKWQDRAGWMDDARYFAQVLHFLDLYAGKMIDQLMREGNHDDNCTADSKSRDPNCPACQVADQVAFVARTGPVDE